MKFSDLSGAARIVAGMAIGVFAYANFGPEAEVLYRNVEVPVPVIQEVERVDTVVTWKERIVYRTVKAEQIATAAGGGRGDVERFCGDNTAPQDSANVPQPITQLLLRSARLEDGWFFQKDRLILTGPLSNGDLRQLTYSTRGSFQTHVHGDTVIVQYPRTALLKQGAEFGAFLILGYVIGSIF